MYKKVSFRSALSDLLLFSERKVLIIDGFVSEDQATSCKVLNTKRIFFQFYEFFFSDYHVLLMKNKMGPLSVTSKITGYKHNYFALENIQFEVGTIYVVAIDILSSATVK